MKKTFILTFALLLAFVVSHAQTEKGTQTVGLDLHYSNQNGNGGLVVVNNAVTETAKYTNFSIGPQYSYFISDKLALGGSLSYGDNTNTSRSNDPNSFQEITGKSYGGSVYLRKYLMYSNKLGIRVGPTFDYTHTTSSSVYASGTDVSTQGGSSNNYALSVTAELVYFPTKHLGLSAMLANAEYDRTHYGGPGSGTSNSFYLDFINSGLSLSVFYSFGSK